MRVSRVLGADAGRAAAKGKDLESELPADAQRLKIGDAAPDFSLKGVDGKTYTLADFKDAPVLMVVFLSNHCPYSHAAETRLLPLVARVERARPRGRRDQSEQPRSRQRR